MRPHRAACARGCCRLVGLPCALLYALFCGLLIGPAHAHRNYTRPDLAVTCKVGNKALLCGVVLPARVVEQVLGRAPDFGGVPSHAEQIALRDALVEVFTSENPVRINGQRVTPTLRSATFLLKLPHDALTASGAAADGITLHASSNSVLRLVFGYPFTAPPTRIDMTWTLASAYTTTSPDARPEPRKPAVPVSFLHDGRWDRFEFTPTEPQHIWHAPRRAGPPPVPTPRPAAPRVVEIPLIAAGALAIGLIGGVVRRRRGLALIAVSGLVAAATWPLARHPVALPGTTAGPPPAAEARAIFEALHGRIYRAFDAEDEGAIYDALAKAVDGPLLEWLYTRIYRGLVMQDQGGAVARAEGVAIEAATVLPAQGAAFRVEATWQVTGTVTHWGHAHQRVNTYTARYTVDRRDGAWKFVAVEPLDQQRVPAAERP